MRIQAGSYQIATPQDATGRPGKSVRERVSVRWDRALNRTQDDGGTT